MHLVIDAIPPSTVAEADRDTVRILHQIRAEIGELYTAVDDSRFSISQREWQLGGVVASAFGIINRHLGDLGSW